MAPTSIIRVSRGRCKLLDHYPNCHERFFIGRDGTMTPIGTLPTRSCHNCQRRSRKPFIWVGGTELERIADLLLSDRCYIAPRCTEQPDIWSVRLIARRPVKERINRNDRKLIRR